VSGNGLLGRYFANGAWEAPAALARIDPMLSLYFHVIPLPRPYTVEWSGKIAIPADGFYSFGLESIDESQLWIDEQPVVAATEHNVYAEGMVELAAGLHDIRIRYADRTDHSHINFYWTPPGGSRQVVPPEVLFPPQGDYGRVTVPDLASLNALAQATTGEPGAPAACARRGRRCAAAARPGAHRGQRPAAAARHCRRPGGARLRGAERGGPGGGVLDPDGAETGRIPADGAAFTAPTDAVADGEGVTVLEAGGGRLLKYAPDGALRRGDRRGRAAARPLTRAGQRRAGAALGRQHAGRARRRLRRRGRRWRRSLRSGRGKTRSRPTCRWGWMAASL
jgi:hypothetical protein